jgi:hypothetical protein
MWICLNGSSTTTTMLISDDSTSWMTALIPPCPKNQKTTYGIPAKYITFRYFNKPEHVSDMQDTVYNICAETYGDNHKWMAFLDDDEFLEMTGKERLKEML